LALTRGRYTISFLLPSHWYGLVFHAEQQYGGPTGTIYVSEERHLIKTHKEDGGGPGGPGVAEAANGHMLQPVVSIQTRRYGSGGKSLENLVVTMRWEQHPDER